MFYQDQPQRSLEFLRLAIPLMTRQRAPATPVSFAVWYVHVAGHSAGLSAEIRRLTEDGQTLDEEQTSELFERYILQTDTSAQDQAARTLRDLMSRLSRSVSESSANTQQYAQALDDVMQQPAGAVDATVDPMVAVLKAETDRMRESLTRFEQTLAENQREVATLRDELQRIKGEVSIDALSGLTNRRGFDPALRELIDRTRREGTPLHLLMVDLDHFKKINDNFGHLTGDRVIQGAATILKSVATSGDVCARYGGEEFALIVPGQPQSDVLANAEKVRVLVTRARLKRAGSDEHIGGLSVSIGIACLQPDDTPESFIDRADKALYRAKSEGRNRVVMA